MKSAHGTTWGAMAMAMVLAMVMAMAMAMAMVMAMAMANGRPMRRFQKSTFLIAKGTCL